jgi:hypothetical protein
VSALTAKLEESIRASVSSGALSGLEWGPRVFRQPSGACVNCRAGTSAGARRGRLGVFVRLCGACWRGAGGVEP